jgi:hypothetical protein
MEGRRQFEVNIDDLQLNLPDPENEHEEAAQPPRKKSKRVLNQAREAYLDALSAQYIDEDEEDWSSIADDVRGVLKKVDASYKDEQERSAVLEGLAKKWDAYRQDDKISQGIRRVFLEDATSCCGPCLSDAAVGRLLCCDARTIKKCRKVIAEGVAGTLGERATEDRKLRSDAFVEKLRTPIVDWFHGHSKYDADRKLFTLLFTSTQLHKLWCMHHDKQGNFWVKGTPEWLMHQMKKLNGEVNAHARVARGCARGTRGTRVN